MIPSSFDEPVIYQCLMYAQAPFGLTVTVGGIYFVVCKSSKDLTTEFRSLLIVNLLCSFLSHICLCVGVTPVMVLPHAGGYSVGLFSYLGLPTKYCTILQIWLLSCMSGSIALLFFHRQFIVLPSGHCLKRTSIKLLFNLVIILIFAIITLPWILHLGDDQNASKFASFKKFGLVTEELWKNTTFILNLDGEDLSLLRFQFGLVGTFSVLILLFSCGSLYFLRERVITTNRRNRVARDAMKILVLQITVQLTVFLMPTTAFLVIFVHHLNCPGVVNVCLLGISLSCICGTVTMILATRPYREEAVRLILKIARSSV